MSQHDCLNVQFTHVPHSSQLIQCVSSLALKAGNSAWTSRTRERQRFRLTSSSALALSASLIGVVIFVKVLTYKRLCITSLLKLFAEKNWRSDLFDVIDCRSAAGVLPMEGSHEWSLRLSGKIGVSVKSSTVFNVSSPYEFDSHTAAIVSNSASTELCRLLMAFDAASFVDVLFLALLLRLFCMILIFDEKKRSCVWVWAVIDVVSMVDGNVGDDEGFDCCDDTSSTTAANGVADGKRNYYLNVHYGWWHMTNLFTYD